MSADLSTVPLVALSIETKQVISTLLNPPKVIPSENGLPRDWRGLAHLCNLSGEVMPLLMAHSDPSAYILKIWEQKEGSITIKDFQTALEEIDRWDILDDTLDLFEADAKKYLEQLERSQTSAEAAAIDIDKNVLTVGDLHRQRQGLENQYYDAFLLYADEDVKFATEMVDKLEKQYNLKLCLKDRDLIGGVTFEHEAVMTLISERCNRLIVIVSTSFLKSAANTFFLNYAQALGIDKRQRKIIPCLYEKCQLPPQLNYMFKLDYSRVGLYDFWGKLRDSVQSPNNAQGIQNSSCELEKYEEKLHAKEENETLTTDTKYLEPFAEQKSSQIKDDKSILNEKSDHAELNVTQDITKDNIKQKHFLQWTKKKLSKKVEEDKKGQATVMETVDLPSLTSLDSLTLSTETMEKKNRTKFIRKYMKKMQLKKVLVKS